MISGSVAVEGQGRALGQVLGQPPPVPEFLRPLPRTLPYNSRYHPQTHIPQSSGLQLSHPSSQVHQSLHSTHIPRHRDDDDTPSSAPAYPPVPGAYARFLPHPYSPYYGPYHGPAPVAPPPPLPPIPAPTVAPAPPPAPAALPSRSPPSAPKGKEGSLKHRLLNRERIPPPGRFSRGALIQLGSGLLRRVEDMRTEDFVMSAETYPEMRLVDSTVVKLLRRPAVDTVTLTLSYDSNRAQVDMESPVEQPFFVYGQGWASCSPERTLHCYGLQVNRLQVGDVCVTLIKRETPISSSSHLSSVSSHLPSASSHLPPGSSAHLPPPPLLVPPHSYAYHQTPSATIVTTATATAMTARLTNDPQTHPENLSIKEDSRKRRWSAPDVCDEDSSQKNARIKRH